MGLILLICELPWLQAARWYPEPECGSGGLVGSDLAVVGDINRYQFDSWTALARWQPMLPSTSLGSGSSNGCNGCGGNASRSSANSSVDSFSFVRADQVSRSMITADRTSNSSFSPGYYSQFDSQVAIFPVTGGTTITFLDINTSRTFTFVDGLNGDSQNGIFKDLQHESARQLELQNASSTVVSDPAQATKVVVKHWNGDSETFQIIDLDPSTTATNFVGRLVNRTNREGRELSVNYKTWTQSQIDESPSRQWQIDTIADSFSS